MRRSRLAVLSLLSMMVPLGCEKPTPKVLPAKPILVSVRKPAFDYVTDFENFTTFKPAPDHEKTVGTVLDQVVAWGGALKQLR